MCLIKHLKGTTYNRAVEYTRNNPYNSEPNDLEIDNMPLMRAFLFNETEEGFDYWHDVYTDLKSNR
jgi:hypothetical protein